VTLPGLVLPRALLLSAVVIWGWTFVATKILVAELGPVEILALRLAIGLPFLGLLLLMKRVPLRFGRADARPLLLGGAILTLHFLVQIAGIVTTTATNTGWIISASPLALAVFSYLFLRERIGWTGVAGIAVATTGILLLVSGGRLADLGWLRSTGDWLVLASAHTWALYTVATRDLARRRDPLAVTFGILLIAAVLTAGLFAASADLASVRALSPRGVAALLYLAIPGLALGQWFWQEGVATLGAARAGLYLYLEPLATVTLAVPLLGEPFGLFIAIGGGLVLAGVYVGQRQRAPEPAPTAGTSAP
jgi:drug/metabolite transporter (DMT)-like permease